MLPWVWNDCPHQRGHHWSRFSAQRFPLTSVASGAAQRQGVNNYIFQSRKLTDYFCPAKLAVTSGWGSLLLFHLKRALNPI